MVGHVRVGRRYLPQRAATGVLQLGDWIRDDLPDLLWPVLLLSYRGTTAARGFVNWQSAVQSDLRDAVEPKVLAECLDGRLTSLDRLIGLSPAADAVVKQRAEELDLLPAPVAAVLATYPERPASWLVEIDLRSPGQEEVDLLAKALLDVVSDGHREAVIKCLQIWSAVQAGTFSCDPKMVELLKRYPSHLESRASADTVVRASWGATKGALLHEDPSRFDESIKWAKVFWGVNSMTTAPSRLYDQERQEVHAGLVSRAGRKVITVLGHPDLWCVEHASHLVRVLVEVRIYLQWMATQDSTIYRRFQEYGSGKAKLYARIMDESPDDARIPGFDEAMEELDRLSHNDHILDYRVVDTGDSFAGKSLRAMAEECGLLDLHRHTYSIASGVTHSEWWSVETHAMERCLNVLHRGHLIPSMSLNSAGNVALAQSWVDPLYAGSSRPSGEATREGADRRTVWRAPASSLRVSSLLRKSLRPHDRVRPGRREARSSGPLPTPTRRASMP